MIGVWVTNHAISYTIGKTIFDSLKPIFPDTELCWAVPKEHLNEIADINIGYGILRNMDAIWHKSSEEKKPYFIVDRGYWKPHHYDGFYRISLNGTQQTTGLDKLEPDYERWDKLGIEILPAVKRQGEILICPQTEAVGQFVGQWIQDGLEFGQHPIVRLKGSAIPLQDDLDKCRSVLTFNSSVGWEALRQGIPVISDPNHSILGAYMKTVDNMSDMSIERRRRFFAIQASLQFSIPEIRSGRIWPLIQRLIELRIST